MLFRSSTHLNRSIFSLFLTTLFLIVSTGCELVASAYVEKQWVTEPGFTSSKPDMTTRFELKASKLVGRDAKLERIRTK